MRIGFIGAGGTGKGTLAKWLSLKASYLRYIPSSVQDVGNLMFPEIKSYKEMRNLPDLERWSFQYAALMSQIQNERLLKDNYISERSIFDYLAYVRDTDANMYQDYKDMVLRAYCDQPYNVLFFLPITDFVPQDGNTTASWKERDMKERRETNEFFLDLLEDLWQSMPLTHIVTVQGSMEEREQLICRILDRS